MSASAFDTLANTLLACHDHGTSMPAPRDAPLTAMADAQAVQDRIVAKRRARGERTVGWKIGFTNRTIWPIYDVHHPIWGPVWDSGLVLLDGTQATLSMDGLVEPRLEPEIVFGFGRTPRDASLPALIEAIDWYAHGFEIVQSVWPAWRFTAAESFAGQSLHAALRVGPRRPLAELADPVAQLSSLTLAIALDGTPVARGSGRDVLDGPLQALAHAAGELARLGRGFQAGELVTTGTLTDAQPLARGQRWTTAIDGVPLSGLTLDVS